MNDYVRGRFDALQLLVGMLLAFQPSDKQKAILGVLKNEELYNSMRGTFSKEYMRGFEAIRDMVILRDHDSEG